MKRSSTFIHSIHRFFLHRLTTILIKFIFLSLLKNWIVRVRSSSRFARNSVQQRRQRISGKISLIDFYFQPWLWIIPNIPTRGVIFTNIFYLNFCLKIELRDAESEKWKFFLQPHVYLTTISLVFVKPRKSSTILWRLRSRTFFVWLVIKINNHFEFINKRVFFWHELELIRPNLIEPRPMQIWFPFRKM